MKHYYFNLDYDFNMVDLEQSRLYVEITEKLEILNVLGVALIKNETILVDVKECYKHNDKFVDQINFYVEKEKYNV